METLTILQEIFRDVFDDEEMIIHSEMSAKDHADWDSLTHMQLIFAVERKFNIKFSMDETMKLTNIGEFISLIDSKT